MSLVHLYLTSEQRGSVLRAMVTMQRWVQGDVDVFAEMAEAGILRDMDGNPLSLSLWSTVVEPALSELASLTAGTAPGVVLDVHDPATHPIGAVAQTLHERLSGLKASKKHRTLAAFPQSMSLHKTGANAFDLHTKTSTPSQGGTLLSASGLTSADVLEHCKTSGAVYKLSFEHKQVHKVLQLMDTYSRLLINQWEYLKELTDDRWEGRRSDWHSAVDHAVKTFKEPWTKYSMNASSGISNAKVHPDAQIVWAVLKSLRHWDMVQRCGYSHRGVSTDGPMRGEQWPLVDGDDSAALDVLPEGAGVIGVRDGFQCLKSYAGQPGQVDERLASSYSLVSLLDAVSYNSAHPEPTPTF